MSLRGSDPRSDISFDQIGYEDNDIAGKKHNTLGKITKLLSMHVSSFDERSTHVLIYEN